jgi:hypothetical protein
MTVSRTDREQASPIGREQAVERWRRVNSIQASVGTFSRRSTVPSSGDCGDKCWDSVLGTGHLRTSGFALTARSGSLLLGPSDRVGWSGNWSGSSLSVDDATLSDNVVPARTHFLLFGRWLMWSWFRRRQARGHALLSAALPLRSLFSSLVCFFPLTATTIGG